ncbi:MAG: putative sugar nucleotidyl transferase [Planctomycetota bacterium]
MKPPLVLFEDDAFVDLLPLLFWRSVFEIGVGRKIVLDRLAQRLGAPIAGVWTREWMAGVAAQRCGAPANHPMQPPTVLVNGRWLPDGPVEWPAAPCVGVTPDEGIAFIVCDDALAKSLTPRDLLSADHRHAALLGISRTTASGRMIRHPWDLIARLSDLLREDWSAADASIDSEVPAGVLCGPREGLHVGERVSIHRTAIIDTTPGPIFLSDDAFVGAYAVLEGPLFVGPGSRINPHAWLHGGNAVGPVCKIGGEVHGCVIQGYTNKQHLGFLGHSYVGSWVNIGAGANNSDLKNTYGKVRVPINGREIDSGQTIVGAIIGDHAKIGINASIPTGAVIGFGASIASTAMLPKFVPSFAWVTGDRVTPGDPLRAMDVASAMMVRRNVDLTDEEIELFSDLAARVHKFEGGARI